jgi:ATP-dependent helicase/nuclease subunit B
LLQLSSGILEHLRAGGSLVVPTRQRAAALTAAYSALMIGTGSRVWKSPDVLSWSGWIDRELSAARARHEPVPSRLSDAGEWLLWREAVAQATSGRDLLAPEPLIDIVKRASQRLDDWGIELYQAASDEAALLTSARAHYRTRCRELGVLETSWRVCSPWLRPSARLRLVGFGNTLGTALARWLRGHGAIIDAGFEDAQGADTAPVELRALALPDTTLEAEAVSDWSAATLRRDPSARLLIVVPRLAEQRPLWQHALNCSLDYRAILCVEESEASPSAYAIEGGEPLAEHPLIAAALNAVVLASGQGGFDALSALLRSPFFPALKRQACLQLELWLREHNVDTGRLAALEPLAPVITSELGSETARALQELIGSFAAAGRAPERLGGRAARGHWARAIAALLMALGWPGEQGLGERAAQARRRFDELLGEFAGAESLTAPMSLAEASALLQRLATRMSIDDPSLDAPVTVTASLDDPIVRYDGLWAAGLSAAAWPQAPRPDPLIPLVLQQRAGIEPASAAGQLERARRAQLQWARASVECVLSWPRSDEDLPQQISPLVAAARAPAEGDAMLQPVGTFGVERWLAAIAPPLESWSDPRGPAWLPARALRGGTRLLQLQSLCPFRAFAELRLGARRLSTPTPGIEAHQRGRIVHRALELFWRDTGDLATLKQRSSADLRRLAQECARRAVDEIARALPRSLQSVLLARECDRTAELIGHLSEWERSRTPFVTQELEAAHALSVAGATLRLRLDRVDRLADGRLVVIDYKSGRPQPFEPYEARPRQPQLPAYAAAAGNEVAAVLALYLGRDGVELEGCADRAGRIAGVAAVVPDTTEWQALRRRWSESLQSLVQEFLDGQAQVTPQPQACDRCHLHTLCRIAPTGQEPDQLPEVA